MSEEAIERSLSPISFRLSSRQLRLIRPGLGLIVACYNVSGLGRQLLSSHSVRRPHLPDFKRQGAFDEFMMKQVASAWSLLCSKPGGGSRLKMNTFQIRACILSLRIEQEAQRDQELRKRKKKNLKNKTEEERKEEFKRRRLAIAALKRLKVDSKRVIRTLERLSKKSSRYLMKSEGPDRSKALIKQWQKHVQWMRMHLVYFCPTPPIGSRRRQRAIVDRFVQLAIEGMAIRGDVPPSKDRLRHLIRLALRYHRSGRFLLKMRSDQSLRFQLSFFVRERCKLRDVEEMPKI